MTLRVGEFNSDISDQFPSIPVPKVAQAIKESGAQVAGVEEGGGEIPQLAADLGWRYYDVRTQIVSQLPLISPPGGGNLYDYVQLAPGKVVALENVHLPSTSYGPFLVAKGDSASQIVAAERKVRMGAITTDLAATATVRSQGIPMFLVGDFNSPSALDWTTAAAAGTSKFRPFALKWPVSEAVLHAGFKDSYRTVYPDPIANPGATWPAVRTPGGPATKKPADRIDFIYYTGSSTPTASRIVGEPGGAGVSATVSPWPSDHRAIASDFEVTPAPPPTLVSVAQPLVQVGTSESITYQAPGDAAKVGVWRSGVTGTATKLAPVATLPVAPGGATDGTLGLDTTSMQPGAYSVSLISTAGKRLASAGLWIESKGQRPEVGTTRSTYRVGQPLGVRWNWSPGDRWDWIGIYHRGANPNVAYYIDWAYTQAIVQGSMRIGAAAHGKWPLPPGKYSVYLLKDDLYVKIAGANFTIRG